MISETVVQTLVWGCGAGSALSDIKMVDAINVIHERQRRFP